jgi:hypothetical protein
MTNDDELGMQWWNGLSEAERVRWAALAGTGRAKDAWELFKGHGVIAALTYGEPLAEPQLVPAEYRANLPGCATLNWRTWLGISLR